MLVVLGVFKYEKGGAARLRQATSTIYKKADEWRTREKMANDVEATRRKLKEIMSYTWIKPF